MATVWRGQIERFDQAGWRWLAWRDPPNIPRTPWLGAIPT